MAQTWAKTFGQNKPEIVNYVSYLLKLHNDPIYLDVAQRAEVAGLPPIHVSPLDGRHLEMLARLSQPQKIVEIGTLAGYSGVCLCKALTSNGKLYTFELDPKHSEVAKETFKKYGFEKNTEIYTGEALKNLEKIENKGPFDFVFIDADKRNYPNYLDWAYKNLKKGGVVVGDNTFGFGYIGSTAFPDERVEKQVSALKEFNKRITNNTEFRGTLFPTGEGLTLGIKI